MTRYNGQNSANQNKCCCGNRKIEVKTQHTMEEFGWRELPRKRRSERPRIGQLGGQGELEIGIQKAEKNAENPIL